MRRAPRSPAWRLAMSRGMCRDIMSRSICLPSRVLLEILARLSPGSFSLMRMTSLRLLSFNWTGQRMAKSTRSLSRKRNAGLQAVRHAELVLDHQQPVQECLGLEIKRVVDVILGPRPARSRATEYVAEDVTRPHVLDARPRSARTAASNCGYRRGAARTRSICRRSARSS